MVGEAHDEHRRNRGSNGGCEEAAALSKLQDARLPVRRVGAQTGEASILGSGRGVLDSRASTWFNRSQNARR